MALAAPEGYTNGCGWAFDVKEAQQSGKFRSDDPLQENYKKTGFFGSITGAFGDKKTMYCHHLTNDGYPAVRAAAEAGKTFSSDQEVWEFLGKNPCCGRMAYHSKSGKLVCGPVVKADHDNTNNADTCIFTANNLPVPIPAEAYKK
mmetsp:Transcript_84972/g.168667  ORF Transcript_84972/g.168667 Transcript_84972/m.168667 type:complete len:146 (+) Transcript_84972:59-496(+)